MDFTDEVKFHVSRHIKFDKPLSPKSVLQYLDMRHDADWWPQVIYVKLLTKEPVTEGSVFEERTVIWGPIKTTVRAKVNKYGLQPDGSAVMQLQGSGNSLSYVHRYTVTADGKQLHWDSKVILPWLLRPLLPVIKIAIRKQLTTNLPLLKNFIQKQLKV